MISFYGIYAKRKANKFNLYYNILFSESSSSFRTPHIFTLNSFCMWHSSSGLKCPCVTVEKSSCITLSFMTTNSSANMQSGYRIASEPFPVHAPRTQHGNITWLTAERTNLFSHNNIWTNRAICIKIGMNLSHELSSESQILYMLSDLNLWPSSFLGRSPENVYYNRCFEST